ncbi:MAG: 4Fe-4S dicluster domain-containing protein, partial [bacterium]
TQCLPDEHCFCTAWGKSEVKKYDLHIQKEETGFSVFAGSKIGEAILKNNSIQAKGQRPKIQKIVLEKKELIDQKELPIAVSDREALKDYWTIVSNNCFGCGSCSIVCPLCFCIRQNFENSATGECKQCLAWDSCFSKGFSEIQNHYDFRPQNIDRLYNWYHHKFVRSHHEDKNFLCTGCGRCIEACPAFLNQYRIIHSLIKKEEKIN